MDVEKKISALGDTVWERRRVRADLHSHQWWVFSLFRSHNWPGENKGRGLSFFFFSFLFGQIVLNCKLLLNQNCFSFGCKRISVRLHIQGRQKWLRRSEVQLQRVSELLQQRVQAGTGRQI